MTRGGAPAPTQRQLRMGEEIRHALVRIFERGNIRDPDLAGRAITVTEVRVSPDLKNATAFITPLGGGDATDLVRACKRAAPFFRRALADEVTMRFSPRVTFQPDPSFDNASRIDDLLRSVGFEPGSAETDE